MHAILVPCLPQWLPSETRSAFAAPPRHRLCAACRESVKGPTPRAQEVATPYYEDQADRATATTAAGVREHDVRAHRRCVHVHKAAARGECVA